MMYLKTMVLYIEKIKFSINKIKNHLLKYTYSLKPEYLRSVTLQSTTCLVIFIPLSELLKRNFLSLPVLYKIFNKRFNQ